MGFDPPTVVFGSIHSRRIDGGLKDTHRNLLENGECVVHIISEWFVEASNHCCGDFDLSVDEIPLSGLTTLPPTVLESGVPRIAEAAVQMECTLTGTHTICNDDGVATATICVARVRKLHVYDRHTPPFSICLRRIANENACTTVAGTAQFTMRRESSMSRSCARWVGWAAMLRRNFFSAPSETRRPQGHAKLRQRVAGLRLWQRERVAPDTARESAPGALQQEHDTANRRVIFN